jgi:uncharacterized membrane protein
MNLAHVHLLLNHFPVIGTMIGIGLFAVSLFGKSQDLQRASLVIFLGIALLTIPTYQSGNAAEHAIEHMPGISAELMQAHNDAALLAFLFMEITGAVSWFGLWQFRRTSRIGNGTLAFVAVLSLITLGLMSNAANIGGLIRHPEIVVGPVASPTAAIVAPWLSISAYWVGHHVTGIKWVWPTLQTLHFMGLSLLLGVVFLVDLRVLGVMKSVSFATVHRLLPWGVLGFGLNLFTGMLYFIAAPEQYIANVTFYWKMVLVMLAGLNAIYFTLFDEPWSLQAGDDAPVKLKVIAASAVALWIGVMFCGLMLPFIGNAF